MPVWLLVSVLLSFTLTVVANLVLFVLSGQPGEQRADDTLGQEKEPKRSQSRECCIVIPLGCLLSVMVILLFSGLALAQLLQKSLETFYEERAKEGAMARKINANWERLLDFTLEENEISGT